jgi:hypothetical protein
MGSSSRDDKPASSVNGVQLRRAISRNAWGNFASLAMECLGIAAADRQRRHTIGQPRAREAQLSRNALSDAIKIYVFETRALSQYGLNLVNALKRQDFRGNFNRKKGGKRGATRCKTLPQQKGTL